MVGSPQHLYYDRPPADRPRLATPPLRRRRPVPPRHDQQHRARSVTRTRAVVDAAVRQLRRLNTNSRFLYDAMTATPNASPSCCPPSWIRCCSSTPAARPPTWRCSCARVYTGRRDVVALDGAYHGWTGTVIDVSHLADGPAAVARPSCPTGCTSPTSPTPTAGAHGADGQAYRASVPGAVRRGRRRAGGVHLRAAARQPGRTRIAGRLPAPGSTTTSAPRAGCASPTRCRSAWPAPATRSGPSSTRASCRTSCSPPSRPATGTRSASWSCRREIADAFDRQTSFFSSTGGGPVSCAIGIAVLDAIRDEGLQENARIVGAHLRQRVLELPSAHAAHRRDARARALPGHRPRRSTARRRAPARVRGAGDQRAAARSSASSCSRPATRSTC